MSGRRHAPFAGHLEPGAPVADPLSCERKPCGRPELLQREHDAEHEALERSITHTASTVSNEALAVAARALAEEIAMHMAIEERDFLNQGVLNDRAARVSPGA